MEDYARKAGLEIFCHHLWHTIATQLLNADADLVTIQDLLGQTCINAILRHAKISNVKVQRDYYKAMEVILQKAANEKGPYRCIKQKNLTKEIGREIGDIVSE